MSTYLPKPGEIKPNWHIIDGTGEILGRLAARVALLLQGKHKPSYAPNVDTGDFVVVINAEKVKVTGRKADAMQYQTYSQYPSGQHIYSYKWMLANRPEKIIAVTVKRMLPKNRMGRKWLTKLKIYKGATHPHAAQQPKALKAA